MLIDVRHCLVLYVSLLGVLCASAALLLCVSLLAVGMCVSAGCWLVCLCWLLACVCVDIQEMVAMGKAEAGFKVPNWVLKAALKMVQSSVQKKSGLDLYKLKPIRNVDKYSVLLLLWRLSVVKLACLCCALT